MNDLLLLAVLAPVALAVTVLCLRQPMRVALPLYAAFIPFGGLISIGPSKFGSASSLAGMLLAAGLVFQLITSRPPARRLSPSVPIWVLFLGVAAATVLWTVERAATIQGLKVLTPLVVVFALAALSGVDRTTLRRTENALMLGGVAAVSYGLFQLLLLGGFTSDTPGAAIQTEQARFGNDMLGPNIQSVTLLVPMAIALNRAFNPREKGSLVPHVAVGGLLLTGVLMTGSRTGVLAAGVVLAAMFAVSPRPARRGFGLSLMLGAAASIFVWTFHPLGLADRTFESTASSSGRLDIWQVGLAACERYCAFGSGWGTFPEVYAQTQASVPGARVLVGQGGSYEPHNVWLLALIESGLLGMLLLTVGLVLNVVLALRLPDGFRPPAVGISVGIAFALIFLSSLEFKIFWMVLLLVVMYRNVVDAEADATPPRTTVRTS